ncbi:adenylate isopentenyltransferase 5, chloroplastic-like [Abrus precatorius]|uniref:adenylate dimethylallyltransferase (ADP/ATP-dependent) n=1 Tax=Abrus precatorius TaxID=3816 RepID=A0A8B8L6P1_ABRPR|nr:adenylate isopentenyltransferase 5, chloroplastic-like [Abrus precatorius]
MTIMSKVMCRPTQPLKNVPSNGQKQNIRQKEKVVLVMGATGTGKSRLSIDLAKSFPAEIINSDKMQVYEGLDIVTNKITKEEQLGVPHHLLGTHNPNLEFTASDFCDMASLAIESITDREKLPIIVGGSNSYIEALVDKFGPRYDWCCLWVDVSTPVLHSYVAQRVDHMLNKGMVNELRPFFNPNGDYSRGIRKAIGVPEFDSYFRREEFSNNETRQRLLQEAVGEVKSNTCKLACKQVGRIHRLRSVKGWKIHRVCATPVFQKRGQESNHAWKNMVAQPCASVVAQFLYNDDHHLQGLVERLRKMRVQSGRGVVDGRGIIGDLIWLSIFGTIARNVRATVTILKISTLFPIRS